MKEETVEKKSPFALVEGEIKRYDTSEQYTSMQQIIKKIQRGHFGQMEINMVSYANKYEFITSKMINVLLKIDGMESMDNKKLTRKFDQLQKNKLLSKFYFGTLETQSSYRVYNLDKNGKSLLEASNHTVFWSPKTNMKTVNEVKAKLAANQFLIAFKEKAKAYLNDVPNLNILNKINSEEITTFGLLELGNNDAKIQVIVESVRREKEYDNLIKRLKNYEEFFNNFESGDSGFLHKPYFILICEDKRHMAEVYQLLVKENINIDAITYYTFDLAQLEESLKNTWYQFEEEKGEIDLKQLDIQILE